VELFLQRVLGLDWSEVDAEAEALEHAISPRLEQAIARHLGEPLEDPHGHPIPTSEGQLANRNLRPIVSFRPGEKIVIREVQDDDPQRLRHWQELGLTPGATAKLLSHQPLDDIYEIEVKGIVIRLGSEGLAGVQGEASA
jgi:DtxR family Mn-dependent transcriptional regulator